ncbi:structural maintenance of chromosomes protein 6 isoform X4 [Emydura macquarii macquarii]|uniref:structural maintenance of chromosomes protein 6 isoform X4 n=1 Tax=Emydura macquarii macquarii TaxID=1129001 RepID=UPI00352A85D7
MQPKVLMGKRKEERFSKPGYHKRPRQEYADESDDELDEEERSQLQSDSNSSSQSTSGEVGIIESIQLKNFMCHSMLGPFRFGSNVNFVVGNNGSGKSAVLTALIVGLGGKATTTNRGSSLKVFVKDGQTSADVSITLRNQGKDAYKPDEYGNSIIVNQHISMDGSRNYKLKSETGMLISSKKDELTAILDHFNIQVDNPVSVLTQEMSKHFLQSKNEGDKYKFFMKATQLEQMKADYSYIMETKARTHDQIEQGVGLLQELRQHYLEKEERYKSIAFVSEMQSNLEDLKHKMAWAVVNETEKEIKPIKDNINIGEGRNEKYDQKLMEWQVKVNEAEEKYKAIQDKLEKISEDAQALQPQCVHLKADVQAKRKAYNEAEAHYNRSRTELKRLEKDDELLRKRIEELKNSADQISEPEKLERQKKVASLKDQLKSVRDQEVMMVQEMDQFQQAIYKDKEEYARLKAVYHPKFPSVLTALEIDNAVAANCLIDMRGIETVLLIKSNREAREVMQSNRPPKNCREAFTAEGDQVFERRYYSSDNTRPKFLSKDVEAEISHLQKEVENKMAQLSTSQQHLQTIANEIRQNEELINKCRRQEKELQIKIRRINTEITDLENVEEHQSVDISTLEDEAQENKNKMESVKRDMQQQRGILEELKNILRVAEHKLEEIKEKLHQVEEIASPVKDELNQADSEVEKSKHHWKHYEERQREHLASIKKLKDELAAKEKELKEKIAQATQICPQRIEVNRTVKSLDTEMNRLRDKINSERDHHGNREEIIKQLLEAKEKYQDAEGKVKNLKKFIKLLDQIMTERYKTYQQFRRCLTLRCKLYFDFLLRQRSYSGKISFDHKNETLSITVQPGDVNKAALNDMRSLSGGERSFSTVCFILSLWSIAESPFRCLDEFDVYMDMVNRRISMDMMLKMADSQRHRQFILLTPQSMSSLPTSNLIRILRMPDPERGQTKLNFQRRHQEEEED